MARKTVNLEHLIGVPAGMEDVLQSGVDEKELRSNIRRILSRRRSKADFEKHFSLFNAFSLLGDHTRRQDLFDVVDAALENYILTCRTKSQASVMLNDLIVDHWPPKRSLRLALVILNRCRYKHRLQDFLNELRYHRPDFRPQFITPLIATCRRQLREGNARERLVAEAVLRAVDRDTRTGRLSPNSVERRRGRERTQGSSLPSSHLSSSKIVT